VLAPEPYDSARRPRQDLVKDAGGAVDVFSTPHLREILVEQIRVICGSWWT
jgi:hypothetical protein